MRSKKFLKAEQAKLAWDVPGLVAGVDEAGRGPLAGPVVAAAVILDDRCSDQRLGRLQGADRCCGANACTTRSVPKRCVARLRWPRWKRSTGSTFCRPRCWPCSARSTVLRLKPTKVLVDGNRLPSLKVLAEAIVSGDALVPAISAASILAKVTRDRMLEELHAQHPDYGFDRHKGYGTAQHLKALESLGPLDDSQAFVRARCPRMGGARQGRQHERTHTHQLARQPLAQALAGAGAGQRRLPQAGPGLAGGRPLVPRLDGAPVQARPSPCLRSRPGPGRPGVEARSAPKIHTVPDALMAGISGLESPAGMGFVWDLPPIQGLKPGVPTVVLDRLQDAGNVGSILRSAAAMGFAQVLAIKGTAALWSPKVLRAGMGAHFGIAPGRGPGCRSAECIGCALAGDQFA